MQFLAAKPMKRALWSFRSVMLIQKVQLWPKLNVYSKNYVF